MREKKFYYKCNVLGGFRLTDINKSVSQNEVFFIEESIANTSRAVQAAINSGWMKKSTEAEYKRQQGIEKKKKPQRNIVKISPDVATPDAKQVNKKLESRQSERFVNNDVATPDINEVKKKAAAKKNAANKKNDEQVAIPDFNKVQRKMRDRQKETVDKGKDEILKGPNSDKNQKIKKLANEVINNDGLAIPNFDERKDVKPVDSDTENKTIRRRRKVES